MNHHRKLYLLAGLKYKRLREWFCDLRAEKPGLSEFYLMARLMVKAWLTHRPKEIGRQNYFQRMWICHHCPIFDRKLKRCRKGELGCGCYVPFKALAPVDCWLREQKGIDFGWGIVEYNNKQIGQ